MADGPAPQYLLVAGDLRRRVTAGEYAVGTVLPRHVDLAEAYGVAKETAAKAVRMLEGEGLVRCVRRRGTVVLAPLRTVLDRHPDDGRGWVDLVEPFLVDGPPPPDVAELLGLAPGEDASGLCRHIGREGSRSPEQIVVGYRLGEGAPANWSETVSCLIPAAGDARALGAAGRTPMLRLVRVGRSAEGGVVVVEDSLLPGTYEARYSLPAAGA